MVVFEDLACLVTEELIAMAPGVSVPNAILHCSELDGLVRGVTSSSSSVTSELFLFSTCASFFIVSLENILLSMIGI